MITPEMQQAIQAEVARQIGQVSSIGSLGQGSTVHGDLDVNGRVTAHLMKLACGEGDPDNGDFTGTAMQYPPITVTIGGIDYLLTVYGMQDGSLQFGLSSVDGTAIFAAGRGIINMDGINLEGVRYAIQHHAADELGANGRYGRLEMFLPDGTTVPAYGMTYKDATTASELVVNGDAETGDTSNWTPMSGGGSIYAESAGWTYQTGNYHFRVSGQGAVSDAIDVTGGTMYTVSGKIGGNYPAVLVEATNAGMAVVMQRKIYSDYDNISPDQRFEGYFQVPASATHVQIRMLNYSGDVNQPIYFDDLSMKETSVMQRFSFEPTATMTNVNGSRRVMSSARNLVTSGTLLTALGTTITLNNAETGVVTAGDHKVAFTFYDKWGGETTIIQESGAKTFSGDQLASITNIPVGPVGTVGRKIYMTKAGGTAYYYAGERSDNVTTWIKISVADADLTIPAPTVDTTQDRPQFPRNVVVFAGQMYSPQTLTRYHEGSQDYGYFMGVASGQVGDSFAFPLFCDAGTVDITAFCQTVTSGGVLNWYLDGLYIGDTDMRSASNTYNVSKTIASGVAIAQPGYHSLTGVMRDTTGSGYNVRITLVKLLYTEV